MSSSEEQIVEATEPYWTIWVMRPGDAEPWCWGGNYDDPTGAATEKHLLELEAEYPASWGWGKRRGRGDNEPQPPASVPSPPEPLEFLPACDGSGECAAEQHVHGCFADTGNCDEPREHCAACCGDPEAHDLHVCDLAAEQSSPGQAG